MTWRLFRAHVALLLADDRRDRQTADEIRNAGVGTPPPKNVLDALPYHTDYDDA